MELSFIPDLSGGSNTVRDSLAAMVESLLSSHDAHRHDAYRRCDGAGSLAGEVVWLEVHGQDCPCYGGELAAG